MGIGSLSVAVGLRDDLLTASDEVLGRLRIILVRSLVIGALALLN